MSEDGLSRTYCGGGGGESQPLIEGRFGARCFVVFVSCLFWRRGVARMFVPDMVPHIASAAPRETRSAMVAELRPGAAVSNPGEVVRGEMLFSVVR